MKYSTNLNPYPQWIHTTKIFGGPYIFPFILAGSGIVLSKITRTIKNNQQIRKIKNMYGILDNSDKKLPSICNTEDLVSDSDVLKIVTIQNEVALVRNVNSDREFFVSLKVLNGGTL